VTLTYAELLKRLLSLNDERSRFAGIGFDSATGESTAADWLHLIECMDWSNRKLSL